MTLGKPAVGMIKRKVFRLTPLEIRLVYARCTAPQRARRARVRTSMQLLRKATPGTPGTGGVWAITVVRNEEDILARTLEHLLGQGIDGLAIADHGSSDSTLEIAEGRIKETGGLLYRYTHPGRYQAEVMDFLAYAARQQGATWIIPFDADEFWFAQDLSLADELRKSNAKVRRAEVYNLFPGLDADLTELGGLRLDAAPHSHNKVASDARAMFHLHQGNHSVERRGPVLGGLYVAHLPWRTYGQFVRKVRGGKAAYEHTDLPETLGKHIRYLGSLDDRQLASVWQEILAGATSAPIDWAPVGPLLPGIDLSTARTWSDLRCQVG